MIWNLLKLMLTSWLSMKRWNNYPRIESVSLLDNLWFSLHTALFLAHLEESEWKTVDKEFIIKRMLFNSFKRLILSDINSWTRDYIWKQDRDILLTIENKAIKYILSLEWPDYMRDDIRETLYNEDKALELRIISASKKYAWYRECMVNERVFPDIYDISLQNIKISLEEKWKELQSLKTLLQNDNYNKYLSQIRRLTHSMRWNQHNRIYPISVMSHLVVITFITYVMTSIEKHHWKDFDMLDNLMRAIYHDIPESITWDIITPTKKAAPWFSEVLEKVEINMMNDYFFYYISPEYKEEIFDYMLNPFHWDTWKFVKHADIISAFMEAKVELNNWWINFEEIYRRLKKQLNAFNLKSIDYILKDCLDSFDEKTSSDPHLSKID
ncbi:MAG: hypothetical protein ACD_3C00205G0014 [uncultured bacterium (gcode 4)]|uniref:HD domain-containing protein n=1 Tax=uncultured bacterium (gcode 4) TaxID=1234023 RepID=K2F8H0_9BACT|nr:MAG: hypothetical protein ACD_3C00205G0014 [uncultured bacterium (gcode 4)]